MRLEGLRLYRGYTYRGYIGIIALDRGYIEITDKNMETTI